MQQKDGKPNRAETMSVESPVLRDYLKIDQFVLAAPCVEFDMVTSGIPGCALKERGETLSSRANVHLAFAKSYQES